MRKIPTIFHVTNHKAGSQWMSEVLKHCAIERFIAPRTDVRHFLEQTVRIGSIYPTIYLPATDFQETLFAVGKLSTFCTPDPLKHFLAKLANWYRFSIERKEHKIFVVIRDWRDVLVSQYFSFLVSHPLLNETMSKYRKFLQSVDKEAGLLSILKSRTPLQVNIQFTWQSVAEKREILMVRYDDLLADEHAIFEKIVDYCQIDVNRQRLHDIVKSNSFEVVAGRKRCQEDTSAHLRKGISED